MPTTVAETYIACVNLPMSINDVAAKVIDGGFTSGPGIDEMTNSGGGGFYEDVATYKKCTIAATLAVPAALAIVSGGIYRLTINYSGTGFTTPGTVGPSIAGNFRVNVDNGATLDVSKGLKYKITATNQGAYVSSL